MRQAVHEDSMCDWSAFVPQTNVLWLHYVLERLLEKVAMNRVSRGKCYFRIALGMIMPVSNSTV